jgi:hypothetical protein
MTSTLLGRAPCTREGAKEVVAEMVRSARDDAFIASGTQQEE